MIKTVTKDELLELGYLGAEFYREANLPGEVIPEVFARTWGILIDQGIGQMWKQVLGGRIAGAIGGILAPDLNDGKLIATETFWYVFRDFRGGLSGGKLYYTFENWAKQGGAKRITMGKLEGIADHVGGFYERLGYTPRETTYMKEIAA